MLIAHSQSKMRDYSADLVRTKENGRRKGVTKTVSREQILRPMHEVPAPSIPREHAKGTRHRY